MKVELEDGSSLPSGARALVDLDAPTNATAVRGSCFLVAGDHPTGALVVTAAHVVMAQPDESPGRNLGVLVSGEALEVRSAAVERWHVRPDLDLAVGLVLAERQRGYRVHAGDRVIANADVIAYEHSSSIHVDPLTERITIFPLFRRGHVVQTRRGLAPGLDHLYLMELSFPALAGASGAPVLYEHSNDLAGVLVTNRDQVLHPTQVLRSYGDQGEVLEEIRYHLPSGLAVEARYVREILSEAAAEL